MGLSNQLKVALLASVSVEALSNVLWTSVVPFVFKCLFILLYTVFIVNFSVFVIRIEQETLRHSHLEYITAEAGDNKGVTRYWGAPGDPTNTDGSAKALNLSALGLNNKQPFLSMPTAISKCQHTAIAGNSSYNRPHSLSTYWFIKY